MSKTKRTPGSREDQIARALDLIAFIRSRRRAFSAADVAQAMEVGTRTAYRWLAAAEANALVTSIPNGGYRPVPEGTVQPAPEVE